MADGRMLIEPIGGMRNMMAKLSGLVAALAVVGSFVVAGASATGATDLGRAFVEKFTEDAKSEGLVKAAIARAGLRGGHLLGRIGLGVGTKARDREKRRHTNDADGPQAGQRQDRVMSGSSTRPGIGSAASIEIEC
jgi:hypothetical protein